MIFDSGVFDDLANSPDKFLQAGITSATVNMMRTRMQDASIDHSCLSPANVDDQGDIVVAYVLSKSLLDHCLTPLLFDLFGVKYQVSGRTALMDLCILYTARLEQKRTVDGVKKNITEYIRQCQPDLRQ
jgi:hypothetical protein